MIRAGSAAVTRSVNENARVRLSPVGKEQGIQESAGIDTLLAPVDTQPRWHHLAGDPEFSQRPHLVKLIP